MLHIFSSIFCPVACREKLLQLKRSSISAQTLVPLVSTYSSVCEHCSSS